MVSHLLSMREALGSIPSVSISLQRPTPLSQLNWLLEPPHGMVPPLLKQAQEEMSMASCQRFWKQRLVRSRGRRFRSETLTFI